MRTPKPFAKFGSARPVPARPDGEGFSSHICTIKPTDPAFPVKGLMVLSGFTVKIRSILPETRTGILSPVNILMETVLVDMTGFGMIIPLIPFLALSTAFLATGIGISNTAIPSLISLMSPNEKQGSALGVTQSVGSVARIPGPVIGGVATEIGGIASPFYLSAALLVIPFILGYRVFRACTLKSLHEPPQGATATAGRNR